jgi:hypothetical protein
LGLWVNDDGEFNGGKGFEIRAEVDVPQSGVWMREIFKFHGMV